MPLIESYNNPQQFLVILDPMNADSKIVGRYAPSPTGDLHLGNLRTALLAWLYTRARGGKFILRMEDIDQPRVIAGSADQILRDLEWLGLDWDGPVVFQSQRHKLYQDALDRLSELELTYPCFCSRKDIQQAIANSKSSSTEYPGTCASLSAEQITLRELKKTPSIRLRVTPELNETMGDFVVRRADNLFAYQLAVTVDDLEQGVTEVLRGVDLLDSTPKQQFLASALSASHVDINYLHVPLMLEPSGNKMSKRDGSYSAQEWKSEGKSAEHLLGYLAHSIGLTPSRSSVSINELLIGFNDKNLLNSLDIS